MNCDECEDKLERFVDRELSDTEVTELRQHLEAGLLRHHDVEEDHVGLQCAGLENGVSRASGLTHRLEVVLGVEQKPQAAANDRVVVDDEHADPGLILHVTSEGPGPGEAGREYSRRRRV